MPRRPQLEDDRLMVVTDYVVYNASNTNRIVFSMPPNLLLDLPLDFAEPGEEIIVEQRVLARQSVTVSRSIRTKEGYLVTDSELNRYYIRFGEEEEDNSNAE